MEGNGMPDSCRECFAEAVGRLYAMYGDTPPPDFGADNAESWAATVALWRELTAA